MGLSLKATIILFSIILTIVVGAYNYFSQLEDRDMHQRNQESIINELGQIRTELETISGSNVNPLTGQP